jgi:hypothetical protein
VGILTSQNTDAPEGLKSRPSVRIHRIPVELPHLTELELRKLRRIRMHIRTLDFRTILKDRLRLPDRPIAQQGMPTRDYSEVR